MSLSLTAVLLLLLPCFELKGCDVYNEAINRSRSSQSRGISVAVQAKARQEVVRWYLGAG